MSGQLGRRDPPLKGTVVSRSHPNTPGVRHAYAIR